LNGRDGRLSTAKKTGLTRAATVPFLSVQNLRRNGHGLTFISAGSGSYSKFKPKSRPRCFGVWMESILLAAIVTRASASALVFFLRHPRLPLHSMWRTCSRRPRQNGSALLWTARQWMAVPLCAKRSVWICRRPCRASAYNRHRNPSRAGPMGFRALLHGR
jgi:hypothetical protein